MLSGPTSSFKRSDVMMKYISLAETKWKNRLQRFIYMFINNSGLNYKSHGDLVISNRLKIQIIKNKFLRRWFLKHYVSVHFETSYNIINTSKIPILIYEYYHSQTKKKKRVDGKTAYNLRPKQRYIIQAVNSRSNYWVSFWR